MLDRRFCEAWSKLELLHSRTFAGPATLIFELGFEVDVFMALNAMDVVEVSVWDSLKLVYCYTVYC